MADVLIHRCTLRVIRRAGWNWGPDPRRITQEAVRVLPELLAKKLSELLADAEDVEIAVPVSLRLRVRMSELVADPASVMQASAASRARAPASLDQKVEFALRTALGLELEPRATSPSSKRDGPTDKFAPEPIHNTHRRGGALSRLLLAWHEHGVLERRLAALPNEEIETWQYSLSNDSARPVPSEPDASLALQIEEMVLARILPVASKERHETMRRRILIATAVAAQLSLALTQPFLWIVLDRLMPVEASRPPNRIASPVSTGREPIQELQEHRLPDAATTAPRANADRAPSVPSIIEERPSTWRVKIDCALPFLALAPLARLGYFSALEAVLEAANLGCDGYLFAAALAYKVLDPPERGWRRSPASMLAASALAGSTKPIDEETLIAFARRIAPHTSALDLILADSLIAGHTQGEPITLHRAGPQKAAGLLTLDTEGCFPIAWTHDFEPLLAILKRLGRPVVLISNETAESALLHDLDAAGLTFVTGVPPTRGDRWQRIQQGAWTNYSAPVTEPIRRAALAMGAAFEEARGISKDLVEARLAVTRASSPELNRSLTLAASVALGMISWKLWRGRGRTTPQQVVERYSDLEGRIRFDASSVHVDLPLGRRHQELRENGFLAPVLNVPWFGDRSVEFGGG
jgi:hypothetical protein